MFKILIFPNIQVFCKYILAAWLNYVCAYKRFYEKLFENANPVNIILCNTGVQNNCNQLGNVVFKLISVKGLGIRFLTRI